MRSPTAQTPTSPQSAPGPRAVGKTATSIDYAWAGIQVRVYRLTVEAVQRQPCRPCEPRKIARVPTYRHAVVLYSG